MNRNTLSTIDWWNLFFTGFFVFLVYIAFLIVVERGVVPGSISLWDTVIMALAAFRLTRLVVYDSIMRWFRDLFEDSAPRTFMGTIKTLVNCPWCMGLWFALIVGTAYFVAPVLWFFVYVLALAALATLIQLTANLIGWSAELKKRTVLSASNSNQSSSGTCG